MLWPSTFNVFLVSSVCALQLRVCGQAMSHCVNYTTRDLIEHWDKNMSSIVLLTDGKLRVGVSLWAVQLLSDCEVGCLT
jgi:hypothetical protein